MSTSVLEMPIAEQQRAIVETQNLTNIAPLSEAHVPFTDDEIEALHRDDAMTAGMISIILGIAFTVLLGLVISVNIWMAMAVD